MIALLSSSRHTRRHAFEALPHDDQTAYAARDVLAFDSDGTVRATAAFFLGRAAAFIAAPALRDALFDELPMVRHAALRALAMQHDRAAFPLVARAAANDPTWWVRRAAIVAAASIDKVRSVPVLRDALEDPFWRVRHAAVRALIALGAESDPSRLSSALGPATSERSAGALSYLRKRLGVAGDTLRGPIEVPNAIVARLDPDPAVVTARVEAGEIVSPAFLVECLGDPHLALRVTAKKRLARDPDLRALELALLWLEEPRVPHAAETVVSLLDALDDETVAPLLDLALAGEGVGAACWALSSVALAQDHTRLPHALRLAHADDARTRRAAVAALGSFETPAANVVLRNALSDADAEVVRIAAHSLSSRRDHAALDWLSALPLEGADVLLRRVLTFVADRRHDLPKLRVAMNDQDALLRSSAIRALASDGALDARERHALQTNADPWVRAAVLDESWAERALANDPQPSLRRAAFHLVPNRHRASVIASASEDSWLRARAAAGLAPNHEDDLRTLLLLSRDPIASVRAAAAESLERAADLNALLDRALARETSDELRIAALTHRSRTFDAEALSSLRSRRELESLGVRAWIDDVLSGFADTQHRSQARTVVSLEPRTPRTRPLGRTGLAISSLAISGVANLDAHVYVDAWRAGCNTFFWEPRYHALGRALRKTPSANVIAGTYHASERAIVSDVERSLRRLGRDSLDVFLLFWVRSPARVAQESFDVLSRLKERGVVRAIGFSTHDRKLACAAITANSWDVVMTRHSAAHPGAEDEFFPLAQSRGVGVLSFSALSYGRVLSESVSASDAYRYSLSQPGVCACVSAPRSARELRENLAVLDAEELSRDRQEELRAHGRLVRGESRDFATMIRRHPITLEDTTPSVQRLEQWLSAQDVLDPGLP